MRRRRLRQEPARCVCMGGAHRAKEHSKPGATAAEHTNPRCVHDELQHTTRRKRNTATVQSIRRPYEFHVGPLREVVIRNPDGPRQRLRMQ